MSLPISGFTAVPNPQMLAFMAAQSFVMMMQAGEGWQYGKRKQSAMTNEEFNKQTPLTIMERQMSELKQAIPSIERSMTNMTPMVKMIVEQYGDFANSIIKSAPQVFENATEGFSSPFIANAAHGQNTPPANQKTNAASNQFSLDALLLQLTNLTLSILKGGIGSLPGPNKGFVETPEQKKIADDIAKGVVDGFQDIDLINPPTSTIIKNPEYRPVTIPSPTDPDADRKTQIAESGLSPLAAAAVASFKQKIDIAAALVSSTSGELHKIGESLRHFSGAAKWDRIQEQKAMKIKVEAAVKKLSSLRIKFHFTYGYYY